MQYVTLFFSLCYLSAAIYAIVATIYGLYLAFSAHVLLGLLVLIAEPSPLILGTVDFFWGIDLAQKFIEFVSQ